MSGAPPQARWVRAAPRREVPPAILEQVIKAALSGQRPGAVEPMVDGLRNANFKVDFGPGRTPLALRIYEHDPSLCQKELDILSLVGDAVPVPEVVYAGPLASADAPPFLLTRFVNGVTFRELKQTGDRDAVAQAAYSAGQTLAVLRRFAFDKPGWLGPGPAVAAPLLDGPDPMPRFVDLCLASPVLQARVAADLRDRIHEAVWSHAQSLAQLDAAPHLVHGDFNRRNLLLCRRNGRWVVAALLDWEFAVSGSALQDFGTFLRYERAGNPLAEPHFSDGYKAAGATLPQDWRRLSQVVDLAALCESLTHADLPEGMDAELAELVAGTTNET